MRLRVKLESFQCTEQKFYFCLFVTIDIMTKNKLLHTLCHFFFTGSPPSKVYGNLRTVAARSSERF
jgi:hypothetical protein